MKTQFAVPLVLLLAAATGCTRSPDAQSTSTPTAGVSKAPPVTWSIDPLSAPITASPASVRIHGRINTGWHIYSTTQPAGGPIATRITVPDGQPFVGAGKPTSVAAPIVTYDDAFRMKVEEHTKDIEFVVPVRAASPVTPGDSVRINVRYQVCNDSLCYPAQTARLAAAVPARRT